MRARVIGKRGGIRMEAVSCVTCAAWPGCRDATAINLNFGCPSWVDYEDGARIAPPEDMEQAQPFQQQLNHEHSARVDHVREEIESERIAPQEEPHAEDDTDQS
jgi:hypothetical protein